MFILSGLILSIVLELIFPYSPATTPTPETSTKQSIITQDTNHVTSTNTK